MDYKKINDYEVIYMVQENDEEAMSILINKYYPVMVSMVKRFLPNVKKHGIDFDDLLQECYISFINSARTFSELNDTLFYTYACFCMNRHLINVCRNANSKKNNVLSDSHFDIDINIFQDSDGNLTDSYCANDMNREFLLFLRNFNIIDSSIIELKYNGFNYAEISTLLGMTLKEVQTRFYLSRRILKAKFKYDY